MARAATGFPTREICELAPMSMRTLSNIEAAKEVEYGTAGLALQRGDDRQAGAVYERHGVGFLAPSGQGAGIRYLV